MITENNTCKGVIVIKEKGPAESITKTSSILSESTLVASGRVGTDWMDNMVKKQNIKAKFAHIDIGVRIEVPAIITDSITEINHDPKFHIKTKTHGDFVHTFRTNGHGYVVLKKNMISLSVQTDILILATAKNNRKIQTSLLS